MKKFFVLFVIGVFVLTHSLSAQINVYKAIPAAKKPEKNGVLYSLPRTIVKVQVSLREIEYQRGPYADYAADLLGIQNPVTQTYKEYELADIHFDTQSEPDPDQYYYIEVDEKASKEERNLVFSFTQTGLIKGVNTSGQVKDKPSTSNENQKVITDEQLFELATTPSIYRKVDTIIRIVTVDTSTIRKRFFNTTFEEKPSEMKAREAADMISRIRESRFNLLTGYQETNFSKETMEYMDKQLQNMSGEYMSLFRGLKTEKMLTFTFYAVPDAAKSNITVCRVSKEQGIVDAADAKAKEVTLVFKPSQSTSQLPNWSANAADPKYPVFYYRIPEMASVSVRYGSKSYDDQYLPVAQFGKVTQLPLNKTRIELYPETGSIKSVYFE
jgi:hypothetical protein